MDGKDIIKQLKAEGALEDLTSLAKAIASTGSATCVLAGLYNAKVSNTTDEEERELEYEEVTNDLSALLDFFMPAAMNNTGYTEEWALEQRETIPMVLARILTRQANTTLKESGSLRAGHFFGLIFTIFGEALGHFLSAGMIKNTLELDGRTLTPEQNNHIAQHVARELINYLTKTSYKLTSEVDLEEFCKKPIPSPFNPFKK